MSKKSLYLSSILLTILVGTVLFWYSCCDSRGKNKNIEKPATMATIGTDQEVAVPITSVPDSSALVKGHADNNTAEGRAKNRRADVIFK